MRYLCCYIYVWLCFNLLVVQVSLCEFSFLLIWHFIKICHLLLRDILRPRIQLWYVSISQRSSFPQELHYGKWLFFLNCLSINTTTAEQTGKRHISGVLEVSIFSESFTWSTLHLKHLPNISNKIQV